MLLVKLAKEHSKAKHRHPGLPSWDLAFHTSPATWYLTQTWWSLLSLNRAVRFGADS
jgi:hypothetical protein